MIVTVSRFLRWLSEMKRSLSGVRFSIPMISSLAVRTYLMILSDQSE